MRRQIPSISTSIRLISRSFVFTCSARSPSRSIIARTLAAIAFSTRPPIASSRSRSMRSSASKDLSVCAAFFPYMA